MRSLLTLCLSFALPLCLRAENVKVILLGGQSNMDGWAYSQFLPANLQSPQSDVLFYNGSPSAGNASTLGALRPNSAHGSDLAFGPELTFGRALADASPTTRYVLIKYAVGGTSLATDWNPTAPGAVYTGFKNTVTSGLQALTAAGYTPEIVGMLWLQGENDSSSQAQADAYGTNLSNLITDVRKTYGANLPFVIGGMGYVEGPYRATVQAAQANAAATMTNVRYFSDDDINTNHDLHFNYVEMQTIGQRFATQMLAIPEPSTVVLLGLAGVLGFVAYRRKKLSRP